MTSDEETWLKHWQWYLLLIIIDEMTVKTLTNEEAYCIGNDM